MEHHFERDSAGSDADLTNAAGAGILLMASGLLRGRLAEGAMLEAPSEVGVNCNGIASATSEGRSPASGPRSKGKKAEERKRNKVDCAPLPRKRIISILMLKLHY